MRGGTAQHRPLITSRNPDKSKKKDGRQSTTWIIGRPTHRLPGVRGLPPTVLLPDAAVTALSR